MTKTHRKEAEVESATIKNRQVSLTKMHFFVPSLLIMFTAFALSRRRLLLVLEILEPWTGSGSLLRVFYCCRRDTV